ncbi:hypothetical protein G6O67_006289 [Ophiocordyceps sinensis]|uniref:Uncharacterized protein n=1 Tax=Ophiocordyceps sinensis TaxID=72228 RepID=A0A8H4LWG4_9HYPO|nr:hypothetical protein G6O67_006289 [Ophiocordyceps sinensis]
MRYGSKTRRREQQQQDQPKATTGSGQEKKPTGKAEPENGGERIPDTPITVFKNRRTTERGANGGDVEEDAADKGPDSKQDSHDWLRRLARATSASPASEPDASSKRLPDEPRPKPSALSRPLDKGRRPSVTVASSKSEPDASSKQLPDEPRPKPSALSRPDTGRRPSVTVASLKSEPDASSKRLPDEPRPKPSALSRPLDKSRRPSVTVASSKDREGPKPTVGFTGLQRTESLDLAKGKRSSVQSDDPTDRIEAEIMLFAPHDNQSERGSVRAPSPQPSSDGDELAEATPRANRHDFASMPTPKVMGAFVETPATVKVERREDQRPPGTRAPEDAAAVFGDERRGLGWRKRDQDTASDPGTSDYNRDGDAVAAAAVLRRRRRARSLPRRRPPMRNSAKLPSVKSDLLELQRIHKIDDSTMDDLEEILLGRRRAGKLERPRDDDDDLASSNDEQLLVKRENSSEADRSEADSSEADSSEPEVNGKYWAEDDSLMDRMSKSLSAGLWNIRFAKQGIARLEDRFSHVGARLEPASNDDIKAPLGEEPKVDMDMHELPYQHKDYCAACLAQASPGAMTYIHLPVPRLYYTTPRFRLSALGLVLALVALWLALESAMCGRYCRPATCSTGDCVFSFDDPTTFGAALPIKLDQWTTGGLGRELLGRAANSALDLVADLEDLALGRSIADVSVRGMSFAQKRQHRRRLAKRGLPLVPASAAAPSPPPPEQRAKWEAWRRARLARDRAREVRDMGYRDGGGDGGGDEGAAIGGDRRVG